MKRKLLATAMIGTFLVALCNQPGAKECTQVAPQSNAETAPCRAIPRADLGPHYCLDVERFGFRGIKADAGSNPWVTKNPIRLDFYPMNPVHHDCRRSISFVGSDLSIARNGDHYRVSVTGPTPRSFEASATADAHGNDLWLSGTDAMDPNLHYYVFFRDKSPNASLPKFLVIEALDFSDPGCKEDVPALATTASEGKCKKTQEARKMHKGPSGTSVTETGVGAGGENP
jgi:hypothetical protein